MRTNFRIILRKFLRNEAGATAIEYGLIAALIGIAMIAGATKMGKTAQAQMSCTSFVMNLEAGTEKVDEVYERCVRIRKTL